MADAPPGQVNPRGSARHLRDRRILLPEPSNDARLLGNDIRDPSRTMSAYRDGHCCWSAASASKGASSSVHTRISYRLRSRRRRKSNRPGRVAGAFFPRPKAENREPSSRRRARTTSYSSERSVRQIGGRAKSAKINRSIETESTRARCHRFHILFTVSRSVQ